MLVQLALGVAVGYGPPPTRRVALRLSAAEPPPEAASDPFSYGEYSLREQASDAVWNLVVKPAVERRRREMEAAARNAADPALARAPVLVPEDAPALASAVASTAAATPQEPKNPSFNPSPSPSPSPNPHPHPHPNPNPNRRRWTRSRWRCTS